MGPEPLQGNVVTVTVAGDSDGWTLTPGDELSFGRAGSGAECEVSDDRTVSAQAGTLEVTPDSVWVRNTSTYAALTLVDATGNGGQALEIPSGRTLLCPFPAALVEIPVGPESKVELHLEVTGLQVRWSTGTAVGGETEELGARWREKLTRKDASGRLRGRLNWLTVLALCEPVLSGSDRVPTSQAVARRIAWAEADGSAASTDAIAQRLHRVRKGLGIPSDFDPDAGLHLARLLVRRSIVRPDDITTYLEQHHD